MTSIDQSAATRPALEVVSDVICPWCYIGKHRLERALAIADGALGAITIRWRPFELNPNMPRAGMERRAYCEAKIGSLEYANQLYARVAANAHADGLAFAHERIVRTPNTRAAHRLIGLAGVHDCQNEIVDALFAAYFVEGRDIGDAAILTALGVSVGLARAEIEASLGAEDGDTAIEQAISAAHELGVDGVPAFIYNGRLLFSGAQSPQTIAAALTRALAKGL